MIIDYTYFYGKLRLPQTGNTEGRTIVEQFIVDYEAEFLKKVLGYELWKAFVEGIEGSGTPDQRWIDLLEGAEYVYHSRTNRWVGFAAGQDAINVNPDDHVSLIVDGPGDYDPVTGNVFTLPPQFVGINFIIEIRGIGKLRSDEYTVSGNEVTTTINFSAGGTIFLTKGSLTGNPLSNGLPKVSPIANYVYYKYMEDSTTDNTLVGVVTGVVDNNTKVAPMRKMLDAWNAMVEMNIGLRRFLDANKTVYPEWVESCETEDVFEIKNEFDI